MVSEKQCSCDFVAAVVVVVVQCKTQVISYFVYTKGFCHRSDWPFQKSGAWNVGEFKCDAFYFSVHYFCKKFHSGTECAVLLWMLL